MKMFAYTILFLFSIQSVAQMYSNAEIFISQGAELNLTSVENDGEVINEGVMRVDGDWQFKGAYDGFGSVFLTSSEAQKIYHTNGVVHEINVLGGGAKQFFGTLHIGSYLNLSEGNFIVNDTSHFRILSNAMIENAGENSFVEGRLEREPTDNVDLFFPVGFSNIYAPVELQEIETNSNVLVCEALPITGIHIVYDDRVADTKGLIYWSLNALGEEFSVFPVVKSTLISCDGLALGQAKSIGDTLFTAGIGNRDANTFFEGCTVSSLDKITGGIIAVVDQDLALYIPNALSPNAISAEDRAVKIYGGELAEEGFRFVVMNKWGDVLFETEDLAYMQKTGWDGTDKNGEMQMAGQYYFKINGKTVANEPLSTEGGAIWIIR